ncbi:hypothetical protein PSTT_15409, partial [Puccinia striiformis]
MFLCEEIFASFENGESAAGLSPPNHHLTILLVIVFCWHKSGLHPFIRLDIIATPVFQLWFGVIIISMILLNIWIRLDNATQAAVRNLDYRADDYKFALTACDVALLMHEPPHLLKDKEDGKPPDAFA